MARRILKLSGAQTNLGFKNTEARFGGYGTGQGDGALSDCRPETTRAVQGIRFTVLQRFPCINRQKGATDMHKRHKAGARFSGRYG